MESPESSKPVATETALAQESPIFSYISNLSPIQPVKAPAVTQGFPELSSPPLVFTSPQLNLRSQPTYLKSRKKFHGLSTAPLSRHDEGCKESAIALMGSENLDSQLITEQLTCTYNVTDVNSTVNDQIESPIECPDLFLTDVMNTDSVDSNGSWNSTTKKSDYVDQQPDATSIKETGAKVDDEHNIRINKDIDNEIHTLTRQTKDVHKEDTTIDATQIETNIKHRDSISDQYIKIESELSVGHALINQEQEDPMTKEEKAGQSAPLDQSSHMLSGSMQIGEENENSVEATGAALTEPALEEAFQRRGVRRRCLQFEDAQHQVISNHPTQNPEDSGGTQNLERPLMVVNENQAVTQPASYPRNNLGLSFMVHKPIGLHLNKIVKSGLQAGSGALANMNIVRPGKFSIRAKKLIPMINSPSDNSTSSSILSLAESTLSRTDDNRHEVYTSEAAISASSLSTCTIKTLNDSIALNLVEERSTPSNKRMGGTITDGVSDDFTKSSVKKKRNKSFDPADGNGCKRCNCKKSNCLKLYCDCFAAGIYCAESCACQSCLNRPQFEGTVLDKRQQIESRNPLAFAPKVVERLTELPASSCEDDQTHCTPSSARHKRGCNCKKSMCVKRYCECYQANVGCSDGCRCEGCQNVFGRKGDYRMIKDVPDDENASERTCGSSVEKFGLLASGNGLYHCDLLNPHNLTPLTPAFQFSNHRKDASEAWSRPGKYFQSPESGLTVGPQYVMSPYSPTNTDSNAKILETANEILDLVPFDPELDNRGNAKRVNNDSAGKTELLSGISNHQDRPNNTIAQSFSVNRQHSSVSSHHWHGSPITPMDLHSGTKHLQVSMQYDTPDVLNDAPTPPSTVKVISPDKKRVSLPQEQVHEFGCSSSAGVKTGRKFILKAVPSFPPLTPCIDSKISAVEPTNDPQNCSNDK